MAEKPVGRVLVNHRGGGSSEGTWIYGHRAQAKYRVLDYEPSADDPISKWRPSKFMKKGTRKPKRFRVRLKEAVAREAREIQTAARRMAMAGLEYAGKIMEDQTEPASARLQAIDLVLNRAYGKPNQNNTNLNIDANGKTEEISSAELDTRVAAALEQFEKLAGGAAKAAKGKKQPSDLREHHRNPDGSEPQLN